jgi:crotonobetainyl-CoA:carnitine CoA-transferase CaiB-like acyl-CoA transferase
MQNVLYRLSDTPGSIEWTGRPKGHDNADVLGGLLGLSESEIAELTERGIV